MRQDLQSLIQATAVHLVTSSLYPCSLSIRAKHRRDLSVRVHPPKKQRKRDVFRTTLMVREKSEGGRGEVRNQMSKSRREYCLVRQTCESMRLKPVSFEDVRLW